MASSNGILNGWLPLGKPGDKDSGWFVVLSCEK